MSTWIFLRGLMREARHWGAFPRVFRAVRRRCARASHLRPAGQRRAAMRWHSPTRIEDAGAIPATSAAARAGRAPLYNLLALSLGGDGRHRTGCRATPQEVAACVLISTSLRAVQPLPPPPAAADYPAAAAPAARSAGSGAARSARSSRPDQPTRRGPQPARAGRPGSPMPASARWRAAMRCASCSPPRAIARPPNRRRCPLLLLAGAADRLVDPQCSRRSSRERWNVPLDPAPDRRPRRPARRRPLGGPAGARDWLARLKVEYGAGAPVPPNACPRLVMLRRVG
ncbi:MAG: hypothetical protein MZW92_63695 [Comamonadaceae bacterium]|nr:hypothetical protein [Comamonadaceae bacterium]